MRFLPAIPIFLIFACNGPIGGDRGAEPSKNVQIRFVDSLGDVSISVPIRYDTVFSWVDYSDCGKACAKQEYRYQPNTLAITKESGFFWLGEPKDSVDRFTISHSSYHYNSPDEKVLDTRRHFHWKARINSESSNPMIVRDTIEKIGDRYFSIFIMQRSDTIHRICVLAMTTLKGTEIEFSFKLLSKKDDLIERDFITNSLGYIHTIRIGK